MRPYIGIGYVVEKDASIGKSTLIPTLLSGRASLQKHLKTTQITMELCDEFDGEVLSGTVEKIVGKLDGRGDDEVSNGSESIVRICVVPDKESMIRLILLNCSH